MAGKPSSLLEQTRAALEDLQSILGEVMSDVRTMESLLPSAMRQVEDILRAMGVKIQQGEEDEIVTGEDLELDFGDGGENESDDDSLI